MISIRKIKEMFLTWQILRNIPVNDLANFRSNARMKYLASSVMNESYGYIVEIIEKSTLLFCWTLCHLSREWYNHQSVRFIDLKDSFSEKKNNRWIWNKSPIVWSDLNVWILGLDFLNLRLSVWCELVYYLLKFAQVSTAPPTFKCR